MASLKFNPSSPSMLKSKLIVTILIFLLKSTASDDLRSPSLESSLHSVLNSNGLPIGLFPKGISDFSIDPATGQFKLQLLSPSPCETKFETHVRYDRNITGIVGLGKIGNLSGLAAQELFLWLPVKGIRVDVPSSGLIYFDVGVVFKQFSLSFFEVPKDCEEEGEGGGGDGVAVVEDGRGRIVENHSGDYLRKHFRDGEQRADS